ncbi:MAG: hypothetical protein IPK28_03330 [Devosia sp.]|nr:hypothetical protein [Devosia sp.]
MIAGIWRTPRANRDDDLFNRFKSTPGIVATYQLANDEEIVVVTIWESAEKRDTYMKSTLQTEIAAANPAASRGAYELINSRT